MSKNPSSVAWLNSKYSRAKGQVARTAERIKDVQARLELHRHYVQHCEEQLPPLMEALGQAETLALQFARALELHVQAPRREVIRKILPNEHVRFFKHGGMAAAIFKAIRSAQDGVLTINELQSQLVQTLELPQEDVARFRKRLQTRLQILLGQGKVTSPDRNAASNKRWMLSRDWIPAQRGTQSKQHSSHRSQGSAHPAR